MPGSTATCSRCGTLVSPGARACQSCGADVSGQQGQVATAYLSPTDAGTLNLGGTSLIDALRRATAGEYDMGGELGAGGMATVFLAHDLALGRKVAIKVMSPALVAMPGMVERFKREARTAASLSHPHIIPIYAVKQSAEVVYFVMKYIEGRSLESVVKAAGALPVPLVQTVLYQAAAALGAAHKAGVVHRDVKPANIMVDTDGWVVVTDFGIAKVAETTGLTMTGATIGTPSYMSPEQCEAKRELTGSSDQYSLGIVAYELLTGHTPFQAETTLGLLFAHVHEPPPPPGPDVPAHVADALLRMLEKDPAKRFPDVEAAIAALGGGPVANDDPVREQLRQLARAGAADDVRRIASTPVSPLPATRSRTAPTAPRTAARPASAPPATPAKRRSPLVWAVPLVLVIGAGAAAVFVLGGRSKPPTAPPTTTAAAPTPPPPSPQPLSMARPETVRIEVPVPTPAETVTVSAPSPTRASPPQRGRPERATPETVPTSDRAQVDAAVAAFGAAFASRDLSRVRRAYPGMTPAQAQEWGTFFLDARNLEARLEVTSFEQSGDQGSAQLTGGLDWESLQTGRAESRTVSYRATLMRDKTGWRLTSLR